ncbi:ribonuclease E inhibitor RraB [Arthrobacter oryzae]|uniref:ribonuclease E inhibitor RraB n=1 Tax=Arthrobacter oryzae TaxID=409290 RepID=UPI0030C9E92B
MTTLSEQLAHQQQLATQQLEQWRGMSDQPGAPRPVDHSGVFPTRESATEASHELVTSGYGTRISDDQGYVLLEAQKVNAIDAETVQKFTEEVLTIFHRFGGDYDGWGAPVVDSPPAIETPGRSWLKRLIRPR